MNIVWDVFVQAFRQRIKLEDIVVVSAKSYSPYYELSTDYLNRNEVHVGDVFEVNPIYRYPEIFSPLLEMEGDAEEKARLFNQLFHFFYIVERELNDSRETFEIRLLYKDIEDGAFGIKVKQSFDCFTEEEKYKTGQQLLALYQYGQSKSLLGDAVKALYPKSYLYEMREDKKILIYPGVSKDYEAEKKLDVIQSFFLPMDYELEIFWRYHFGILDLEDTMALDAMELY